MTAGDDELGAWLGALGAPADPDVVERLLTLTRALRPEVVDIDGRTALRAPGGVSFAAVDGRRVLVRTNGAPGTLEAVPVDGLAGWFAFAAWPADVAFRRGTDVLRDVLRDAFALASAVGEARA
jgi:hypothetical protein